MPILSTILWLPIVAAVVLAFFPRTAVTAAKSFAFAASLLTFLLSLLILGRFEEGRGGFQMVEMKEWIPQWGVNYALGIDGIAAMLGFVVRGFGDVMRFFQTGNVRNYALMFFLGVVVFIAVLL